MITWETVDVGTPGGPDEALSLHRRGDEWCIRLRGAELMNSRRFGSERSLATCAADAGQAGSARRVLVGGLGMGHTLAAALAAFPRATVVVAEISPRVIEWNRGALAPLAGDPLADPRSQVFPGDVTARIRASAAGEAPGRFDAILLDVDNGPEALLWPGNAFLYSPRGLALSLAALAPEGVLGIWSAGPHSAFERRLRKAGCDVEHHRLARSAGHGRARHTVWIARRARGRRAREV